MSLVREIQIRFFYDMFVPVLVTTLCHMIFVLQNSLFLFCDRSCIDRFPFE